MVDANGDSNKAAAEDASKLLDPEEVAPEEGALDEEEARQQEEIKKLEQELELGEIAEGDEENKEEEGETQHASAGQEDPDEKNERSVFVKNVDFSADEQSLIEHFKVCGEIARVTILKHYHTQQPKGQAFIEFATKESSIKARHLNESLFKGRQLTVIPKRKNKPGMSGARGGFGGGRGMNASNNMMVQLWRFMNFRGGRGGFRGGRGGGFRGRGRGGGDRGGQGGPGGDGGQDGGRNAPPSNN